jgi:hypothetical protein
MADDQAKQYEYQTLGHYTAEDAQTHEGMGFTYRIFPPPCPACGGTGKIALLTSVVDCGDCSGSGQRPDGTTELCNVPLPVPDQGPSEYDQKHPADEPPPVDAATFAELAKGGKAHWWWECQPRRQRKVSHVKVEDGTTVTHYGPWR